MSSTVVYRQPSVLWSLSWKESVQLLPLLLALAVLSSLLHLLLSFIPGGTRSLPSFLILIPNIFAIGAPPLSIGQEDETGTLRTMRGWPVGWGWIAAVKGAVAVAGLCLVWLISLALMALTLWNEPDLLGGAEVFSVEAIGGFAFAFTFSLYLLVFGFAVSWWLRTPIASLLTMLPLVALFFIASLAIAGQLQAMRSFASVPHTVVLATMTAVLFLLATGAAHRTLRHPLVRRRSGRWQRVRPAGELAHLKIDVVPLYSPNRYLALLWQATEQSWWLVLPLWCVGIVTAGVTVLLTFAAPAQSQPELPLMIALLSVSLLGATVFVFENKHRRHRFLADHGIASWTIWWTRQAVPLLAALTIAIPMSALAAANSDWNATVTSLLFAAAFVCGQLCGQAFRRPIVGLFAAPLALAAISMLAVGVFALYPTYLWTAIGGLLFLWLVTLRLCRRWSEERVDAGYYGRLAGWIGLAALATVGSIAAARYATTPPGDPDWRESTLARARQIEDQETRLHALDALPLQGRFNRQYDTSELRKMVDAVLQDERSVLGYHASSSADLILSDLRKAASLRQQAQAKSGVNAEGDPPHELPPELYGEWLRAMLLSARRLYQNSDAVWRGRRGEPFERAAVDELLRGDAPELLGEATWRELVALVPTAEQRAQWRAEHLLRGWALHHRDPLLVPFFPNASSGTARRLIPAEQWRTGRFVDQAVRISLQQLATGIPPIGSPEAAKRLAAWQTLREEATAGSGWESDATASTLPTADWTLELERNAARLRRRASG